MTHTPTRVDIKTEGWISGTDMPPLPRNCQTATCHHKSHQLSKSRPQDAVTLDAEWLRNAVPGDQKDQEKSNRGWAMPSTDVFPALPPLDLPTVFIRRGGIRHWPMIPSYEVHMARRRLRWEVRVSVAGQPYQVVARRFRRKRAEDHVAALAGIQSRIFDRIKDHVIQHGW